MLLKPVNTITVAIMLAFSFLVLFFSGFIEFPSATSSFQPIKDSINSNSRASQEAFSDLVGAFRKWDSQVGCARFREKHSGFNQSKSKPSSLQEIGNESQCGDLKLNHVSVLVKGWTWIPDNLDNLYSCRCGMSCLWTKSSVLADKPDALLFETTTPPLRVGLELNCSINLIESFEIGILVCITEKFLCPGN